MSWHTNLWTKLQSLGFFVFAAAVACGVGLLFLPLLKQSHGMQEELLRLDRDIARQEARERQQQAEIEALKTDPSFVERTARNKLNVSRPGETIFRFEQPTTVAVPARSSQ